MLSLHMHIKRGHARSHVQLAAWQSQWELRHLKTVRGVSFYGTSSRSALRRSVVVREQGSSSGMDMARASGVTGSLLDLRWRLPRRSPLVFLGMVGVISSFCKTATTPLNTDSSGSAEEASVQKKGQCCLITTICSSAGNILMQELYKCSPPPVVSSGSLQSSWACQPAYTYSQEPHHKMMLLVCNK